MIQLIKLTEVGGWSVGKEDGLDVLGSCPLDTVRKREFECTLALPSGVVLGGTNLLTVLIKNSACFDDLDGARASAMTAGHIHVHGVNSTSKGSITVLAVHIVSSTTRAILKPNSKVLNISRVLLGDFVDVKNLT